MEQNREPRNKPMNICPINLQQRSQVYNGEKTFFSINGVRETGLSHAKD